MQKISSLISFWSAEPVRPKNTTYRVISFTESEIAKLSKMANKVLDSRCDSNSAMNAALEGFKAEKLAIYGKTTDGLSNDEIILMLKSFSDGEKSLFEQFFLSSVGKYQAIADGLIENKIKLDNETGMSLGLKDISVVFTKDHQGKFFVNLLCHVFSYSIPNEMLVLMQEETYDHYCSYDSGVIYLAEASQVQSYQGKIQKNDISLKFDTNPLVSLRARFELNLLGDQKTVSHQCVELEMSLHSKFSYEAVQNSIKSIEDTATFDIVEKNHNDAIRLDIPCRLFSFTEAYRSELSQTHTQYHNFDSKDLVGHQFLASLSNGTILPDDYSYYKSITDKGYQEFSRGVRILGYQMQGDIQDDNRKHLIDAAIFTYSRGDRLFEHRLRCGPGQSNVAEICEYLTIKNHLILRNGDEVGVVRPIRDPKQKCIYTTNSRGEKYLNILLEFYTVTSLEKNEHYCLSNNGKLELCDGFDLKNPSEDKNAQPIIAFQARVRLERRRDSNDQEILFYDFTELNLSINHPSLSLSENAKNDLGKCQYSHYRELLCRLKNNIAADMPIYFSENRPAELTPESYEGVVDRAHCQSLAVDMVWSDEGSANGRLSP